MKTKHLLLICLLFTINSLVIAQDCQLPIVTLIDNPSTNGFTLHWTDSNDDILNYELEIGTKGFTRTFSPNIPSTQNDTLRLNNLLSGTTYEVYIRTVCTVDNTSPWNGPYFSNTIISNGDACDLQLDIPDNTCPKIQEYQIEVDLGDDLILGEGFNINSVDINIAHTWPPDLDISLTAPNGETASLSRYNGNGRDNYGNPSSADCMETATFTDDACLSISEVIPPLVGQFRPENNLRNAFNGVNPSGIWILNICDRARGDIGQLKGLSLNFSETICRAPENYSVDNIEADNVSVSWSEQSDCNIYKIAFRELNAPLNETSFEFIECDENTFTLIDLTPDTEYIISITTRCNTGIESPESCPIIFRTACANSTYTSSFNELETCPISCDEFCIVDPIWYNLPGQTNAWIVNEGSTPSEFTGPTTDINGNGKYLYIENNIENCHSDTIILESTCLQINDNTSCHLSFFYHMYGGQISRLEVQQSIQENQWTTLWSIEGEQGNEWIPTTISLSTDFDIGQLRIIGYRGPNVIRNDIAIDQIKLIGVDTFPLNEFYVDNDGDGFGDANNERLLCSINAPIGFSNNSDDCDDTNPNINPNGIEISCNLIDENCNGNSDDNQPTDLDYNILSVIDETCQGREDGRIEIQVVNGQEPYTYNWSNGGTSPVLENIGTGVYTCTISDFGTCQIITESIFVDFENLISYSLISLTPPSCQGLNDGTATLLISGGTAPYEVIWDENINGSQVNNLSSGNYEVTITDATNCSIVTDPIVVNGSQVITAGVSVSRDVDCNGGNNGFIQLGINGGSPPYVIEWSNGETTPTISQLTAGNYAVTISDDIGCTQIVENIEITEPDTLVIIINNTEDNNCPDDNTGMIDVSVTGGTAPFSFFWSEGSRTEDLLNINAGSYSLTVNDFNGCLSIFQDIIIESPEPISVDIDNIINVNCPASNDGLITVNVSGGQPSYIYNWSVTDGIDSMNNQLSLLNAGLYSLTVVDEFGCKSNPLFFEIVNRNRAINVEAQLISSSLCFGDSTAAITAIVNNGQFPYDYNWSSGDRNISESSQDTITQLLSSTYNLTVTDAEGCIGIADSVTVNRPQEIVYDVINIIENDCWYEENGQITIDVSGGTGENTILWNNGQSGNAISNLSDGQYQATITDENSCKELTNMISLSSHDTIKIDVIVSNSNGNDGQIEITPTRGLTPFSYIWSGPIPLAPISNIDNLIPGDYNLRITDREGCFLDTIFNIQLISSNSDIKESEISIYPNPGDGYLTIDSDTDIKDIQVYNVMGQSIHFTQRTNQKKIGIQIESNSDGLFYIEIITDDGKQLIPYVKSSSF
ncbi:fibronectin type III domain-containing protein [Saprospiraceae bacterium]|nr:fibronectin type III domain-containing protein [Saprospiraceae bacterium]